ncbi:hypothetical protein Q6247_26630, partial [Klebsiella pneumoniae]
MSFIYAEGLTLNSVSHVFARALGFLSLKTDHLETAFGQRGHIIKLSVAVSYPLIGTTEFLDHLKVI